MNTTAKNQTTSPKTWEKIFDFLWHRKRSNVKKAGGLFGAIFERLEVIMLLIMTVMALNLHFTFVDYITKSAKFITDVEESRFWFANRLSGSLLLVEIILALATSYFRYNEEWDKSIFATITALVIAGYNHYTIDEIFHDFKKSMESLGFASIHNKMLLTNWLVFVIGETVGFVMHSKNKSVANDTVANNTSNVTNNTSNVANEAFLDRLEQVIYPLVDAVSGTSESKRRIVGLDGSPLSPEAKKIGFEPRFELKTDTVAGATDTVADTTLNVREKKIYIKGKGFLVDCPQCGTKKYMRSPKAIFCSEKCRIDSHRKK